MKKKIRSRKTYLILTLVSLLIASLACNLPDFGQGEPHEEPFHEGEGEPHPEDEAFEHHEEEMDPHEEEHDEHHDEGDHEEPHEEDPGPEADLAVTDIFPKKLPHGKLNVRVTNNGPTPLTSYPADLTCEAHGVSWGGPEHGEEDRSYHQEVIIQAAPGETVVIKTDIKIDANLYQYDVICEINADIDPIPDNNAYDEVIPPSNNP